MKSIYQPDLTILIPAFREEKRIGLTLNELSRYLKTEKALKDLAVEVLVVAADSQDRTKEIVLSKKRLFKNLQLLEPGPPVGKGRDVKYGMVRAKGKTVLFFDADLATPLHHINKFLKLIEGGTDIVIGVRNLNKHHPNPMRRLISITGNVLFKISGGVWVDDSQCGFKMFKKEVSKVCFSKQTIDGWGFDMEILAIAKANNFSITQVVINDWVSVEGGSFEERIMHNSLVSLKELGHIFINRIKGYYVKE